MKKSMKIHEIIPMKMLGKAMKLFHRFLIEFSRPLFHGLFMSCFGDKPMKTHSFMANEYIPWIFHGNRPPTKTPNAIFIGSLMGFSVFTWEIHGNFSDFSPLM